MEQPGNSLPTAAKPHTCTKPCCQCKAIRIMRNQCLDKNKEEDCIEFVNGFKNCVEAKKLEALN